MQLRGLYDRRTTSGSCDCMPRSHGELSQACTTSTCIVVSGARLPFIRLIRGLRVHDVPSFSRPTTRPKILRIADLQQSPAAGCCLEESFSGTRALLSHSRKNAVDRVTPASLLMLCSRVPSPPFCSLVCSTTTRLTSMITSHSLSNDLDSVLPLIPECAIHIVASSHASEAALPVIGHPIQ